jgi:two-component system, NarL family, sensor histidine kinase UhpB
MTPSSAGRRRVSARHSARPSQTQGRILNSATPPAHALPPDPLALLEMSTSQLVQAAHEAIVMIDSTQHIAALNPAAEQLLGLPAAQALGQPLVRFLPEHSRAQHPRHVERFARSEEVQRRMANTRGVSLLRADGRELPVAVVLSRVDLMQGGIKQRYVAALICDLSDTVALEQSMRQIRQRLRLVFDLAPVALWLVENEEVVFANREALQLLGVTSLQALRGLSVYSLLRPDSHGELRRQVRRVLAGQVPVQRVRATLLRRPSGWHEVELALAALPGAGQGVVQMVVADVTRREQETQALARSRHTLRQLSASVVQAREDERRRIARELHDELGQRLTALKMDLSALADEGTSPPQAERVASMLAMLDDTVASVRRIAADLRPMMLDDLGLYAAVQWLAGDAKRRLGLNVGLALEDSEPALSEPMSTALYRIVQEALTNVARHAQASTVSITLHGDGAELTLCVQDNGIGLPAGALQQEGSYGLLGMQERVQALGGSLEVSNTGAGTRLEVRLPLPKGAQP